MYHLLMKSHEISQNASRKFRAQFDIMYFVGRPIYNRGNLPVW